MKNKAQITILSLGLLMLCFSVKAGLEPEPVDGWQPVTDGSGDGYEGASPGDITAGCEIRVKFSIGDETFSPGQQIEETRDDWGLICMIGTVHYITNWIFYLIMIVVMVMVLYGAFVFLTSSGDPTKTSKATKVITYAVIGMVIGLLARAVPQAVKYITGMG